MGKKHIKIKRFNQNSVKHSMDKQQMCAHGGEMTMHASDLLHCVASCL